MTSFQHFGDGQPRALTMPMSTELIRVLVVEDDEVSAKAVGVMLERLACSAEIAEDGARAIECFRRNEYDLVLMGWQMPVMDGFEATARMRAMPRGQATPIIGTTPGRDRAECLAAGMNDLMPKPFQIEKLRLVLLRWTSWPGVKESGGCQAGTTCV
jgi:CheY-like chemotaxis protein